VATEQVVEVPCLQHLMMSCYESILKVFVAVVVAAAVVAASEWPI